MEEKMDHDYKDLEDSELREAAEDEAALYSAPNVLHHGNLGATDGTAVGVLQATKKKGKTNDSVVQKERGLAVGQQAAACVTTLKPGMTGVLGLKVGCQSVGVGTGESAAEAGIQLVEGKYVQD
ncbi:hypothetical protein NDU88_004271 [Pleurodeles waltl]|uniref:Uncharacterized protein n=1 Tax=Pleurodeles waltl TaxID=8319 RepID=A0AAV7PG66_PLEWA|nr:hypothetical protein NDU88_004271 [Pleurodeles waltl]